VAFTTKSGNPTSITGTDKVDVLSSVDLAGNFIVKADEAADIITLVSSVEPSQLTDVSVFGQDGVDTISSPSAALFRGRTQGGEGNDNITYGTVNTYSTYGGADNDTINVTTAVNSTIQGSKGNDRIAGLGGGNLVLSNSFAYGGANNDTITVGTVTVSTVQGSAGNDVINMNGSVTANSKINGGSENDTINIAATGSATKGSTINGNKGADVITALNGADLDEVVIYGGSGNDSMTLQTSQTTLSGDLGFDTFNTGVADDVSVSGGDGNDIINVVTGDALFGVAQNTTATSSINGGLAMDSIVLANSDGKVTVMQGRTDSAAATLISGNSDAGAALTNDQLITFGNKVDVVTGYTVGAAATAGTDTLGTELDTAIQNLSFWGYLDQAANDQAAAFRKGALVANNAIKWGDLAEAGQTYAIGGTFSGGATTTFTIGNADADNDLLIIQGDGSLLTANTSSTVIVGALATAGSANGFGAAILDGVQAITTAAAAFEFGTYSA
jgi:hypothetical protein